VIIEARTQCKRRGIVIRVFGEVQIVEPRGVLEQMDHAHRVRGLPWVLERDPRREAARGIGKVQLALLFELEHRQGSEAFRNRADTEERVGRNIDAGGHIRLANAAIQSTLSRETMAAPTSGVLVSASTLRMACSSSVVDLRAGGSRGR